ncbi:MAG: cation-transporting P-type ATPase [Candidatus Rokubacteria bacterium]|nr:cation-transporting P-type ATPase [Candidatus Rokubacteria bacterium]
MAIATAPTSIEGGAAPWALPSEDVLDRLGVARASGLDPAEIRRRRRRHGPNVLREPRRRSAWRILLGQFESVLALLLAAAAALAFAFGEWAEAAAIAAVIVLNTAIGFATELSGVRSMEALRRLGRVTTNVRRGGAVLTVPAQELVPGDLVLLEGGDVVTADLRLLEASNLGCDESTLTGESVPVTKRVEPVATDAPVTERASMAFKGTTVVRGAGEGVVVATGTATELGRIASLVEEAGEEPSPLERRLERLGGQLVWVALGLAAAIAGAGVVAGREALVMVEMGVALAVAAVPEGLPIVATVALARGMWRMARRSALVTRLPAVETLGATTVILTDKTGTLTENRMAVARMVLATGDVEVGTGPIVAGARTPLRRALEIGVLCNDATLPAGGTAEPGADAVGDPMEIALLEAGARAGLTREALRAELPEVREEAFDPAVKMMATVHRARAGYRVAVKGAPEAVLEHATTVLTAAGPLPLTAEARADWRARAERLAREGLRVLGLATRTVERADATPWADLTLVGLVGLLDPPRPDVAGAIAACRRAGVRIVMVTGDHAETARAIATRVGLTGDGAPCVVEGAELRALAAPTEAERARLARADVFARVSPEQKLGLVALFQARGDVVAMTGDGVNDAPALRRADIGIAMGRRGTQAAREAADMVLRDDAFPSVVAAMEQGRVIFANIRKFAVYLLSCNLSEVLAVGVAALGGLPLPLLPLQILYLNLVTDVFPAFALGAGEGAPGVMREPPRDPRAAIVTRRHWVAIGAWGTLIMAATLAAFAFALIAVPAGAALTVSFLTLAFAQLWHVFNMRARGAPRLLNDVTTNPFVWGALALCVVLIVAAVQLPALAAVLRLAPPGTEGWALAIGASLVPVTVGLALPWRRRGDTVSPARHADASRDRAAGPGARGGKGAGASQALASSLLGSRIVTSRYPSAEVRSCPMP